MKQELAPDAPDAAESRSPTSTPSPQDAPFAPTSGRPRLVDAVVERDRGWNSSVRVTLQREEVETTVERQAVGEEAVVLRSVADATLDAVAEITGDRRFALVGVKRLLAFDSAVVLACIRRTDGPPQKLIGCVPIQEDPVLAVARAVLHATNRIIESMPNVEASDADEASIAEDDNTQDIAQVGADPSEP